jgi:hypothetical protein
MNIIYNSLEDMLNYDVVCIIKNILELNNQKSKLIHCMDQIKSINNEYTYLVWAYKKNRAITRPPSLVCKFILNSNNDKVNLNNYNY